MTINSITETEGNKATLGQSCHILPEVSQY